MKIVKLAGGLGNQMFIYAFGMALAEKYKKIYFDKKDYENNKNNRVFELNLFPNLQIKFKKKSWFIHYHKNKEKNAFIFDNKLFDAHLNEYWSGYFQNEKYFSCIENKIRHAFQFPAFDKQDAFNKNLAKSIKQCENPVFIHIRRGDYVNLDNWLLDMKYYINAVKYIKKHIKNPTFFVFSDADAKYIKNLKIGCKYKYIGTYNSDNNQNFRDMHLMSLCKHAIVANSSFSWWGAWLQKNKNHIVCAPSPWLESQDGIICDNWIKIKH